MNVLEQLEKLAAAINRDGKLGAEVELSTSGPVASVELDLGDNRVAVWIENSDYVMGISDDFNSLFDGCRVITLYVNGVQESPEGIELRKKALHRVGVELHRLSIIPEPPPEDWREMVLVN